MTAQRGESRQHDWVRQYKSLREDYEWCVVCGIVRRHDDKNKPCRGPARLRPIEGGELREDRSKEGSDERNGLV